MLLETSVKRKSLGNVKTNLGMINFFQTKTTAAAKRFDVALEDKLGMKQLLPPLLLFSSKKFQKNLKLLESSCFIDQFIKKRNLVMLNLQVPI